MTADDMKRMMALSPSRIAEGSMGPGQVIRAVEGTMRRLLPGSEVAATIDDETEDQALVRDVLEEPRKLTVRMAIRMPVAMDMVSMTFAVSGDGDDGNDGKNGKNGKND